MKIVLANGNVVRVGGRVVKNVAGYDLCKLFTGSHGSLGVITEVNFKLRPRPEREATLITRGNTADLISSARTVLNARLFPVAAEIVSPVFADRIGITAQNLPVLLIRFAGNEKGVSYQIEKTVAMLEHAEVISDDCKLWQDIAAAPLWEDYRTSSCASILPSELSQFCDILVAANGNAFVESIWQIGALDGRVRMLEQWKPKLNTGAAELMRRVKHQLDPGNIFLDIPCMGERHENTSPA